MIAVITEREITYQPFTQIPTFDDVRDISCILASAYS